jgi:mycothiol synthase
MDDLRVRMEQPWFRAQDVLMLDVDGTAAGFCWLKVEERGDEGLVGEIYVIGVAPEARGIGAGRYLVARALQRLAEQRVRVAAIYVDETNKSAIDLYQSSGFHYHHVDVSYTLALTNADANGREAAA